MASGKQLSFQYGEVAPSLRFRSDVASYSSGLAKLTNMFVRRSGGVSNRAGFEFVKESEFQYGIPSLGGDPWIKGFVSWDSVSKTWKRIEYVRTGGTELQFHVDGVHFPYFGAIVIESPTPIEVRFTPTKDKVFVAPNLVMAGAFDDVNTAIDFSSPTLGLTFGSKAIETAGVVSTVVTATGIAPDLPVSYLLTSIHDDGTELIVSVITSATSHPHASKTVEVTLTLTVAVPEIKYFNVYRAAGAGGLGNSFFRLAGRMAYDGVATVVKMSDYGAEVGSLTPPLDFSMLKDGSFSAGYLSGANCAAYYQQRLIMGMEPGVTTTIKSGDMIASKLGAPEQIRSPQIYTDTDGFQFSIPVTDGTPVVALLAMERLVAFTQRAVYVIRGGQSGELTPTLVNPFLISEEGCSPIVEPKMIGRRGYFINNAHTKLMAITVNADGSIDINEATLFSDHLLFKGITQLEVLGGGEDTVYLLRRDGKLVRITIGEDGVHGFSLEETEGYIESIYRGKEKRPYQVPYPVYTSSIIYTDTLYAYVIRNGIRTVERVRYREDKYREGEFFADCYVTFGERLTLLEEGKYGRISLDETGTVTLNANIENSGSWLAGSVIKVHTDSEVFLGETPGASVLHFFYDLDGEKQYLQFNWDGVAGVAIVDGIFTWEYSGTFTSDVPVVLRDAKNQTISTNARNTLYTRWAKARNYVEDTRLRGPWLAGTTNPATDNSVDVSIMGDGEVISSPLNPYKDTLTIDRVGAVYRVELPDFYSYGYVGRPYTCEFETLDLETQDQRTLTDARKLLNAVGVGFNETRGGFYGIPDQELTNMTELVSREDESFNNQTQNASGHIVVNIPSSWNEKGRINIKHVDPTPISILSVYPKGIAGD